MDYENEYRKARKEFERAVSHFLLMDEMSWEEEYWETKEHYEYICTVILENLMKENSDILKRLKEN